MVEVEEGLSGGRAIVTDLEALALVCSGVLWVCVGGGSSGVVEEVEGGGDCARDPGESSRVGHAPPPLSPPLLSWLSRALSRRNAFCLWKKNIYQSRSVNTNISLTDF